jgi:hypothetical protein
MADLIPISDEQARLGQEALKTLRGLGSFLAQAMGSTPEDLIGYLGGDWLRVRRAENMARMFYEAKARLTERGVEEPQPASLSVGIPLLQGAADEDRNELTDLWSRLLANAMDPSLRTVRYRFIEAVKKMDPPDAIVLKELHQSQIQAVLPGEGGTQGASIYVGQLARQLNLRPTTVEVSVSNLLSLGFFRQVGSSENWHRAAFFQEFMQACYPEIAQ